MIQARKPWDGIGFSLITVVLFLFGIGLLVLYSATGVMSYQKYQNGLLYTYQQAVAGVFGLSLMYLVSRFPVARWSTLAPWLLFTEILLVAATHFSALGHAAQGASRWLRLGPLAFQPSELAKIVVSLYVARLLTAPQTKPLTLGRTCWRLFPLAILLVLILRQPDLGTTALLTVVMLSLLFVGGMPISYFIGLFTLGFGGFLLSILSSDYRRRRLMAFLDPWSDPQGVGFQTIQSFLSFHSGHWAGSGLGNGNGKLFYLPEVHTDFIFALVGEELGFLGTLSLLVTFVFLGYLLFQIIRRTRDRFSSYLAIGLSLTLMLQVVINLGGVVGLVPMKGLPLPFLSWGRSALVVNLVTVGILWGIHRQSSVPNSPQEI